MIQRFDAVQPEWITINKEIMRIGLKLFVRRSSNYEEMTVVSLQGNNASCSNSDYQNWHITFRSEDNSWGGDDSSSHSYTTPALCGLENIKPLNSEVELKRNKDYFRNYNGTIIETNLFSTNNVLASNIRKRLTRLGFTKVLRCCDNLLESRQIYKKLTLMIHPHVGSSDKLTIESDSNIYVENNIEIHSDQVITLPAMKTIYYPLIEVIPIHDFKGEEKKSIIGYYVPMMNTVIICLQMFDLSNMVKNFVFNKVDYEKSLKYLEELFKKNNLTLKTIDNSKEILKYSLMKVLENDSLRMYKANLLSDKDKLFTYNEESIKLKDKIKEYTMIVNHIEELKRKDIDKIIEEVNKAKELPFVERITINEKGLTFYFKEVVINFKGKKYNMGKYRMILSQSIKIQGLYPVNSDGNMSDKVWFHPHVSSSGICFGQFQEKINNLRMSFNIKELCFLIYSYLKSFNPDDNYIHIESYWDLREKIYKDKKVTNYGSRIECEDDE